jgi:predicted DCC family thiol-disulfide oxidoreductase YuxK
MMASAASDGIHGREKERKGTRRLLKTMMKRHASNDKDSPVRLLWLTRRRNTTWTMVPLAFSLFAFFDSSTTSSVMAFQAVTLSSSNRRHNRCSNQGLVTGTTLLTATTEEASLVLMTTTTTSATTAQAPPPRGIDYDGPVILFDGVCNFCNAWVDILLRLDTAGRFKFAPLQSTIGQALLVSMGRRADDISSVVLIDQKQNVCYDKSDCVLKVVETTLGGLHGRLAKDAATSLVPLPIRNRLYDTVAENRYQFIGRRDECRCGDPQYGDRFLS